MTFKCTYRDATGAKAEAVFEAEDRRAAFARLKARGVTVLTLEELAPARRSRKSPAGGRGGSGWPLAVRAILALALLAGAGFLAARVFRAKGGGPVSVRVSDRSVAPTGKPAEQIGKPAAEPRGNSAVSPVSARSAAVVPAAKAKVASTNALVKIGPDGLPIPDRISTNRNGLLIYHFADGHSELMLNDPSKVKAPRRTFRHRLENLLLQFVDAGADLPPLDLSLSEEQIVQGLASKIVVDPEKDDEEAVRVKGIVSAMKDEMSAWMKNGGKPIEYLRELEKRQAREAYKIDETRRQVLDTLKTDGPEEAKALLDAYNEHLRKSGLPPLRTPPPLKRALGE